MFSEKHIQTIQQKKHVRIRKVYGGMIATGAVISTISLLFDLVFYVAKKKEIDEIGYKKIRQTQKCNAGFFYLLYYYEICITDILSPNFLSNLLNKSHLLPLIFIS